MIDFAMLENMFAQIRENTDWDLDGPLVWGYYFTDPMPEKFQPVKAVLLENGYREVGIFQPSRDDEEEPVEIYILHMEKIEHHTPTSLHKRNQELEALARQFDLKSYDGMDVGPVDPPEDD